MGTNEPLLVARDGDEGPFFHWLESLGLRDFVKRFPVSKLVEWGWLVPQYAIRFPDEFFKTWKSYPYGNDDEGRSRYRALHELWDSEWFLDAEEEPYWFLHPFFRPEDESGRLLRELHQAHRSCQDGDTLLHENGRKIVPYGYFFFHWQAYALVDVISFADCRVSLFNTPNIDEQAAGIARIAAGMKGVVPTDVLKVPNRWGGHSEAMTWLSHYRALRGAFSFSGFDGTDKFEKRRRAASLLASHLGITDGRLEEAIQEKFLVLANQWHWGNEFRCKWAAGAWPELQKDIRLAVDWLCVLNGRSLDYYLDKWRHKHWGGDRWLELRKVLPLESFAARDDFIDLAPEYLKTYNEIAPTDRAFTGDSLKALVDRLRATNYPFGSLLHAFRELHEALVVRAEDFKRLDMRERRPLDHYLLVAIRVEAVLRYGLEQSGALASMKDSERDLQGYILRQAGAVGLSARALEYFQRNAKRYTQLRDTPPSPIAEIMQIQSDLAPEEHYLVQAFLCCLLARNYFAHHYYMDSELLRSKESGFMLGGILVSALLLA